MLLEGRPPGQGFGWAFANHATTKDGDRLVVPGLGKRPQGVWALWYSDAPPSQFKLPPSTSVFMFCSACMNLVRRLSLSAARAASSGSIELSKNRV